MRAFGLAALLLMWSGTSALCSGYDDVNAGIAARNNGEWESAIVHFDQALAASDLRPDLQMVAHQDRGEARAATSAWDGAIDDYTFFLAARPSDEPTLLLRADAFIATGKPDAAMRDVEAILNAHPDDRPAQIQRMRVYEAKGDAQNYLKYAQAYLAQNPQSATAQFEVGIANFWLGRASEAADAFGSLTSKGYFEAGGGYIYGWLWLALTDLQNGKSVSRSVSMGLDLDKWPGPIIEFFRGHASEEMVNAAARQGDPHALSGQICEAEFYLGEWRRFHGDANGARQLFQKAGQNCPGGYIEFYGTMAELHNAS